MAEELTHELVPTHEKLSDTEAKALLERYHVSHLELPKISRKDPGIAHLEPKSGEIIKITRASTTAGEAIYYRVVVNA
jgi:DNA-directed RNA polymerase subunit H